MTRKATGMNWATATWKGARIAQLRAARRLSIRQRLLAMEELNDLALRLAAMPRVNGNGAKSGQPSSRTKQ